MHKYTLQNELEDNLMARENFRKIKLLQLLEMLRQNTDEQHPMSTSSIISSLAQMEITCDRRTLFPQSVRSEMKYTAITEITP